MRCSSCTPVCRLSRGSRRQQQQQYARWALAASPARYLRSGLRFDSPLCRIQSSFIVISFRLPHRHRNTQMDNAQVNRYFREIINTLATSGFDDYASRCFSDISYCSVLSRTTDDGVPVRKLFIGNLAERTTNKDLEKLFSTYGKVESCYLKRNNGKSNFAFVTFANSDDALEAREAACRMAIQLHCRVLRVSPADSWHQPDSIENQRKYCAVKDSSGDRAEEKPQEEGSNDDAPIHMLNDDCLMEVFLCLPIADRIRMERVCKRWQAVSQESWRAVKRLDLATVSWGLSSKIRQQSVDTAALRKVLLRCGGFLNHIDFSHPHLLGSSALTIVGKFCPNLRVVDISNINLSQSGLTSLMENCQNITRFSMKSLTGPCEKDLSLLFAVNKKLKYLKISEGYHISGKCLAHLPCETIEEIDLRNGVVILSCHIDAAIQKCQMLRTLSLSSCVCLGDSTLHAIATRQTLTTLRLLDDFPTVSASAMQQVALLVNLESLTVRKNYLVTDTFLQRVAAGCKRLTHLDIYGCTSITNEGMASVATLPNLQHLVISYIMSVTDEALAGMHNLRTLECRRCAELNDPGISTLIEMAPNLELLDLSGCLITNSTLEVALRATKRRSNNTILKIIVGDTLTNLAEITDVSPLLQIVNVCLDHETCVRCIRYEEVFDNS